MMYRSQKATLSPSNTVSCESRRQKNDRDKSASVPLNTEADSCKNRELPILRRTLRLASTPVRSAALDACWNCHTDDATGLRRRIQPFLHVGICARYERHKHHIAVVLRTASSVLLNSFAIRASRFLTHTSSSWSVEKYYWMLTPRASPQLAANSFSFSCMSCAPASASGHADFQD
jgi:hypothetical protein